jgi:hypothetical protein
MPRKPWTASECERLVCLREVDKSAFAQIGLVLGRSSGSCHVKYLALVEKRQHGKSVRAGTHNTGSVRASCEQLQARAARQAASYRRTFTQEFFGDPPPGYSALEWKNPYG